MNIIAFTVFLDNPSHLFNNPLLIVIVLCALYLLGKAHAKFAGLLNWKLQNQRTIMIPILLALAFIAILLIVVITGQPDEFKVVRSATISAPPERVFPHVNDFHKWEAWSPWAKLDPNAKNSFAGAASGTGAAMSWSGNKKIGEGRMTITGKPGE